ncbi:hypothetical protein PAESOLCIP111_06614 [Paenibacillus solanacearum]|uniref:Uncharacterized protein n=1 Tax=Paenibacillus solanacearum TaxID=2048548 RepID=A0A916KAH3_9BACL|nr:hypothetical protein PAESOLCIP111_06614 [Paenibacillus solanacearum]
MNVNIYLPKKIRKTLFNMLFHILRTMEIDRLDSMHIYAYDLNDFFYRILQQIYISAAAVFKF